jgi:type II secretory pathway component PulF
MAFSCASAGLAVTVVLFVVVPQVEGTFQNYGVKLPAMTVLLLKFSKFCRAGGIVAVWGLFAVIPFIPPLFDSPTGEAPRRRYFSMPRLLLTLFLLVFFGWIIFALFTPYVTLINSISGPPGKR